MLKKFLRAVTICALVGLAAASQAQTAQDLVGSWQLVSITSATPGRDAAAIDEKPSGSMMFGSDGRFMLIFLRGDLPKFASDNRATGTPEENRAVVQGSIALFGTYAVKAENGPALILNIENGTFPNWAGVTQLRTLMLNGNELTYITPGSGGAGAAVKLRRVS